MKPATSRAAALAIAASTIPLLLLATASSYANTYHPPHSPLDTQASLEIHVAALEAQLTQLGSELPPQDLRLIEPQQDYARALQQLGRHEQAIAAFGAALQIHRSHHGLFDIDQLALVDRLLESHMALGQWEAVDDLQHFRYQIARHALPAGADTRIDALMQLTVWKLRASEHGLLEHSLRDADEVADLHRRELDLVEHAGKPDQVARHHLGIADLALLQARAKVATRTAVGLG
jgi:tetratricopeptide (TPR) repeat protein